MEPFTFKKVEFGDSALLKAIFRLRFEVYARECGFIREADYPEGLESDEYDEQSVHFAALDRFEDVVGTLRLIMPGKQPLLIEKYCPHIHIYHNSLSPMSFAEISRLIISRKVRRRKGDELFYSPEVEDKSIVTQKGETFLRRAKPMAFGLYRELYRESKKRGLTHWYSLMEKELWLLLRLHGFKFECIGDEVDVFGPVKPYLGKIATIEKEVAKKFPKFFEYFTEDVEAENLNNSM